MKTTMTMRIPFLALALSAAALAAPAVADDAKPEQPPAPTQPIVLLPEALPPALTGRTVSGRVTPDTPPAGAAAGELDGLRAVTLREGAAELSLGGVVRKVKIGDALGSGTVRAIGADRIVLERPFSVPGGTPSLATVIVTFGKGGVPRVRTFVDVGALPPPVPFEEAH
jgi:hypothetical protein